MSESSLSPSQRRPSVTDSPWFWVVVFAAAGLVAIWIISGQYAKRQRRLEMQYQAAQEIARRQVMGEAKARPQGLEGEAPPPATGELIIPLWPLVVVFTLVLAGAATMLWREARGLPGDPRGPGASSSGGGAS
jgi:hypothetical protein